MPMTSGLPFIRSLIRQIRPYLKAGVYFGKYPANVPDKGIVFFPASDSTLGCGIAGIVSVTRGKPVVDPLSMDGLNRLIDSVERKRYRDCTKNNGKIDRDHYLGGNAAVDGLYRSVRDLNRSDPFYRLFLNDTAHHDLKALSDRIAVIITGEAQSLTDHMGRIDSGEVDTMVDFIDRLRDVAWCLSAEILPNLKKTSDLIGPGSEAPDSRCVGIFKNLNAVLNSIDRLEVRGRDSAGISLMFNLDTDQYATFKTALEAQDLLAPFDDRCTGEILLNRSIRYTALPNPGGPDERSVTFTYKVAAEIGSLGDNTRFLRKQISEDRILQLLTRFAHRYHTVSSHTRWASIGAISEANCHPVDNSAPASQEKRTGTIHVCLNGDIDNYLLLKKDIEDRGVAIDREITSDTKIIPLQIQRYLDQGVELQEAFRLAVNDFDGSHAIMMQSDLAPDKLFLAQKGSGQAIYIGLAEDHYMPTSEVYGFVEETSRYVKVDGEVTGEGKAGLTQGQIFSLNQNSGGGIEGINAIFYDGTPVDIGPDDVKETEITSRDIDRQDFAHYFLKEISESPLSVEKTIQNRWRIKEDGDPLYTIALDDTVFPDDLKNALTHRQIQRIFFVGQGTAGVASQVCSDILNYYLNTPSLQVNALKASELSGFKLGNDAPDSMADTLVIFISQSGTTTDTNRTADMVKERGAHTIAIVNRRDSDITTKVHGVMYTSNGRDLEMSVASTKAFYSQIVAGAILGLNIAALTGRRDERFISEEVKQLLEIPAKMRRILTMGDEIEASAKRLAVGKTYWAAVGSGPNKASADEIRIKLSELCYKTISSDYVEDKKHIDLSSEPLIIICAAGTRDTVIGDIVKDTAIFQAHKATPVVIASEGEQRFNPYAADVFHVPVVEEHLAPIVNTLVGHIWGYYAALAINEGSEFLDGFRKAILQILDDNTRKGMDIYETILEETFREKIAHFYNEFRRKKSQNQLPTILGHGMGSDLTLLLKYLSGKLPVSDFEIDFDIKGTAGNMVNTLLTCVGESIDMMSRPVDAIKHQAKTVTVGTSRISETVQGILFDALADHGFSLSQLVVSNIVVLRNLQGIVSKIEGAIRYRIDNLNLLGEPTDETTIEVLKKEGSLAPIPSRVEADNQLKGTKRIIAREGNIYIGIGRKDDRSIIIIPLITTSSETPNLLEYLLLLNISFKDNVSLDAKIKALG
ncbi:MAG: SIS domain-containing protein, partial [Desulfobacterales bacterium]